MRTTRRRLLRGLGLGVSAPLLAPITRTLLSEAMGAPLGRRLAIFFVTGETIPFKDLTPAGVLAGAAEKWDPVDRAGAGWPAMFDGLAPYKDRTVILDGLANLLTDRPGNGGSGGVQHGTGWGCLTGLRPEGNSPEYGGTPTGISIDQLVAQRIGRETPVPSILVGMNGNSPADYSSNTFSAGPGRPLAHCGRPSLLQASVFGKLRPAGTVPSAAETNAKALRQSLLDSMRDDIRRLERRLAAPERARLGDYLAAIDEYDKKQTALAQISATCSQPPAGLDGTPAKRIESMLAMATLALQCGLTNVLGISIGSGFGHDDLQLFNGDLFGGNGYGGHGDGTVYSSALTKLYQWSTRLLGQMLKDIGPLADSAALLMTAASGTTAAGHHANALRWFALAYDGTGTLRSAPGGRYLRYARSSRSVVDLYSAVAHAVGAPVDSFGGGGFNRAQGPLPELMR